MIRVIERTVGTLALLAGAACVCIDPEALTVAQVWLSLAAACGLIVVGGVLIIAAHE